MQTNIIMIKLILVLTSMFATGCAMQVKSEAKHVVIITQEQATKCELIKVINTYDVSLKLFGDGEAEGAQNQAKNRVSEIGGNAMRIISISNQEVKDKNKTYITVEAYKCSTNANNVVKKTNDVTKGMQIPSIDKPIEGKSNNETKILPVQITVSGAQQRLAVLGYNPGPADGKIGGKTVAALKLFQKDQGLTITGQLDTATATRLSQHGSK